MARIRFRARPQGWWNRAQQKRAEVDDMNTRPTAPSGAAGQLVPREAPEASGDRPSIPHEKRASSLKTTLNDASEPRRDRRAHPRWTSRQVNQADRYGWRES